MIFWLMLGIYLTGWLVTAPKMAQFYIRTPDPKGRCHSQGAVARQFGAWAHHSTCKNNCGDGCWHVDPVGTLGASEAVWGALSALFWPLVAPVGLTFYLAQPRPAKSMSSEEVAREIARAERDLGIGQ